MSTPGQQPPRGVGVADGPPPVAVQQTTVIQVGSHKSVVGAVLLALFFGPLGMLYSTVVGALVMFGINLVVVFVTLGLGLFITIPIGAVWAGIAASNHNNSLGAMSAQAVAAVPGFNQSAVPAGWHDDPDGGDRLRYWDGARWTEHFADRPGAAAADEPSAELEAVTEAPTETTEVQKAFCGSCGEQIGATDRFCASCGKNQDEIG